MRSRFLLAVALVLPFLSSAPLRKSIAQLTTRPASATQPSIPLSVLQGTSVIGKLGLPLGTCAQIQATVIAGRDTRMKEFEGRYLLQVTELNHHPLPAPIRFEFRVPGFSSAHVAGDEFSLYKMKYFKEPHQLTEADIAALEQNYVGATVHLTVYETGGFSGIPAQLPPHAPIWQDHGFGFSTYLVVLADEPTSSPAPP